MKDKVCELKVHVIASDEQRIFKVLPINTLLLRQDVESLKLLIVYGNAPENNKIALKVVSISQFHDTSLFLL